MTETRSARRRGMLHPLASVLVVAGLLLGYPVTVLLGGAVGPAAAESASLGSVPPDVAAYVSGGGLVARLNNVYGPNASGTKGIAFDATTKTGPISRVYEWTADRLANKATDHPVQLTNNWVVPITIGDKSVGLATIWINPQTVQPELAEFAPDARLGTALTTVPATAALVRDTATGAWLALDASTVTPLVAGRSGLSTPAPVSSLTLSADAATPITAAAEPNTGLALAIGLVGLIVVIIVVALLVPRGRRARRAATSTDASASATMPTTEVEPAAEAEPTAEPAPVTPVATPAEGKAPAAKAPAARTPAPRTPAAKKPPVKKPAPAAASAAEPPAAAAAPPKPAPPKPATPKPAVARPAGRTPTNSAASKPASSKPGATKPSASKPPASTPPAPRQPPRPRTPRPKPPTSGSGTASDS